MCVHKVVIAGRLEHAEHSLVSIQLPTKLALTMMAFSHLIKHDQAANMLHSLNDNTNCTPVSFLGCTLKPTHA